MGRGTVTRSTLVVSSAIQLSEGAFGNAQSARVRVKLTSAGLLVSG